MVLNDREKDVLEVIREDPFISQQDLAKKLGVSRSTAANTLSSLVQKGYLLGRAYVINEERPIVCIGAANIDNRYIVQEELVENTSNNVQSAATLGGGARNVAENIGRLGIPVELISVVGNDNKWKTIKEFSQPFIDLCGVTVLENGSTGSFVEIIGKDEELLVGLADMAIYEHLTVDMMNQCIAMIQRAKCIIADLNCPKETIEFLQSFTRRHNIPFYLLTVSVQQMKNMPDKLDDITLITKHNESEAFLQMPVKTEVDLKEIVQWYLNKGVKEVILSRDNTSIVYGNQDAIEIFANPRNNQHHYHWGLNEAFCGAMVYAQDNTKFPYSAAAAGAVNAFETGESKNIVRTNLSPDQLKKDIEHSPFKDTFKIFNL